MLALDNATRGLCEIELSGGMIEADFLDNWDVLGEAIQNPICPDLAAGRSAITYPYACLLTTSDAADE